MTAGENDKQNSPRNFYGRVLNEAERIGLEEASQVEGIGEEIALLRNEAQGVRERASGGF